MNPFDSIADMAKKSLQLAGGLLVFLPILCLLFPKSEEVTIPWMIESLVNYFIFFFSFSLHPVPGMYLTKFWIWGLILYLFIYSKVKKKFNL